MHNAHVYCNDIIPLIYKGLLQVQLTFPEMTVGQNVHKVTNLLLSGHENTIAERFNFAQGGTCERLQYYCCHF